MNWPDDQPPEIGKGVGVFVQRQTTESSQRRMSVKQQKMKRRLLVILVVALSATTVTFGVTHQQAAIAQAPDEAAVREVLLKSALAFEKNDVDLITKAWARSTPLRS